MLNLLWSALNLGLLLGFLYLSFRAVHLLKQHVGLGAAAVFGIFLLTMGSKARSTATSAPPQNLMAGARPGAPLGDGSALYSVPLGFTTLQLVAEYYKTAGAVRPRGLYATVDGIGLGHRWQPLAGSLQPQGRQLRYSLALNHTWCLLGTPVFSSVSELEGLIPTAKPL
ncbi:hypothetical protein [Hymenobacter persicinus]|uniref:Uncharacterized protein n=1 Tax=Hymenobacter persicinus TaxID=2025506 RepID=A0A4Q5LGH6_9BACT|nr:hypothetical protein [Hymenobacter persicinus]RYU84410.1 hypothetical protein EWM57_01600 [Hymenobacter persicinus]